jgi:hypothetical protein
LPPTSTTTPAGAAEGATEALLLSAGTATFASAAGCRATGAAADVHARTTATIAATKAKPAIASAPRTPGSSRAPRTDSGSRSRTKSRSGPHLSSSSGGSRSAPLPGGRATPPGVQPGADESSDATGENYERASTTRADSARAVDQPAPSTGSARNDVHQLRRAHDHLQHRTSIQGLLHGFTRQSQRGQVVVRALTLSMRSKPPQVARPRPQP